MTFVFSILFGMMPLLWRQVNALIQQSPLMLSEGQEALLSLLEQYPTVFSEAQVRELIDTIKLVHTVIRPGPGLKDLEEKAPPDEPALEAPETETEALG